MTRIAGECPLLASEMRDLFRDSKREIGIFLAFFFPSFPSSDSELDKSVMRLSERQLSTRVQLDDGKSPGRNTGAGSDERVGGGGGWEEGGTRGAHFHRNSARMATPSNATIPQRNLEMLVHV